MRVPYPRERGNGCHDNGYIREDANNEDSIVLVDMVAPCVNDLQRQPDNTGDGASCMYATQVLQRRAVSKALLAHIWPAARLTCSTEVHPRRHQSGGHWLRDLAEGSV